MNIEEVDQTNLSRKKNKKRSILETLFKIIKIQCPAKKGDQIIKQVRTKQIRGNRYTKTEHHRQKSNKKR